MEIRTTDFKWTPKMEELAQKHYTPEKLAALRARDFSADDQARVSAAWASVYEDIESLGKSANPTSDRALAIGRRAYALIAEITQDDPAMFKAVTAMKSEMMKDATVATQCVRFTGRKEQRVTRR